MTRVSLQVLTRSRSKHEDSTERGATLAYLLVGVVILAACGWFILGTWSPPSSQPSLPRSEHSLDLPSVNRVEPASPRESAGDRSSESGAASGAEEVPESFATPGIPGEVSVFLPYPNSGTPDFEDRYRDASLGGLQQTLATLQRLIDNEARALMAARLAKGDASSRLEQLPSGDTVEFGPSGSPPEGQGRVWPCTQVEPTGAGPLVKTVYLTEQAEPQLFAHVDEIVWIVGRIRALEVPVGR